MMPGYGSSVVITKALLKLVSVLAALHSSEVEENEMFSRH